jgi:hypothetical protein
VIAGSGGAAARLRMKRHSSFPGERARHYSSELKATFRYLTISSHAFFVTICPKSSCNIWDSPDPHHLRVSRHCCGLAQALAQPVIHDRRPWMVDGLARIREFMIVRNPTAALCPCFPIATDWPPTCPTCILQSSDSYPNAGRVSYRGSTSFLYSIFP